jgi:hypothetical protein
MKRALLTCFVLFQLAVTPVLAESARLTILHTFDGLDGQAP